MVHKLFLKTDFIPSFLIAFIVDKTSSLINKFFAFDAPLAKDANKIHLILILLSPLI